MKARELRQKSKKELQGELIELLKEHFNLRMQKGMKETIKPHLYKQVRKNIARVKTIIAEKGQEEKTR